uniref:C2H2-type domain-containing protein n=1 Tax=Anopheles dirus TaxID=7168 RepID=A0A182NAJ4_9DIPT
MNENKENEVDIFRIPGLLKTKQNNQRWQALLQKLTPSTGATSDSESKRAVSKKQYECDQCQRRFVLLSGMERHKKKYHPTDALERPGGSEAATTAKLQLNNFVDIVVKCKGCGEIFPSPIHFENHSQRFNWESLLAGIEGPSFDRPEMLLAEQLFVAVIHIAFRCEFCDAFFSDLNSLFYHESRHVPAEGFTCTFCELNFPTLDQVLAHRSTCSDAKEQETGWFLNVQKTYSCNVCLDRIATIESLYQHRYANHHYFPRSTLSTSQNGSTSGGRQALQLHCEICGFLSNHVNAFLEHRAEKHSVAGTDSIQRTAEDFSATKKAAHSSITSVSKKQTVEPGGSRPYLCEKCGKTYTQSSHLWQHLRFHNGVRPFSCNREGCTRRFTIRPDLNDHIRKCHTGERPYECEDCHKRFLTGSVYYQHRLIHRGERRYGCPDCPRRFYRADALKNHLRIHTGEKPYACTYCDRKFRQRGDREKHIRVKHMKSR